ALVGFFLTTGHAGLASTPGGPAPTVGPAVPAPTPLPRPPHSRALDHCKRFGCHPQIAGHSPSAFGEGMNLTLNGSDFGNVRGQVQMINGGVTVDLPIHAWGPSQIVAGYQGVVGVPGGAAQIVVTTTDGAQSNLENATFKALFLTVHLPAVAMHVDVCAKGASDNQCNGTHVGEGDLQQFDYKNPPSIVGHHYDFCRGPFCFGGGSGSDQYSIGSLKNGFTIVSYSATVTRCGYREKDGSWANAGPGACAVVMKKLNIEDDHGTFAINWGNLPETGGEYRAEVDVRGPAGMSPF